MRKGQAKFIVLEGIDGSGTTTQALLLGEELTRRCVQDVVVTREPYDTMLTRRIRAWLQEPSPPYGALLLAFALDRQIHLNELILPVLARGGTVICDRYIASTLVYQPKHNSQRLVSELCRGIPTPDLYVHLDVSPDVAATRVASRSETADAYEKNRELQRELAQDYVRVLAEEAAPVITIKDDTLTILGVHERVVDAVCTAFSI